LQPHVAFTGMPGFSLGQKVLNKCGMRASGTGELVFQDVKVPVENLLGKIGNYLLFPAARRFCYNHGVVCGVVILFAEFKKAGQHCV
jgi:alkylation response protein AidB-like acyl-CoA dehydrogenase